MYIRQHGHEAATFEISDGPEQDFLGGLGFALCISLCLRLYSRAALQHLDGFMAAQILLFIAVICAGRISLVCAGVLQLGLDIEAAWQMQICTYLVSRHSFCAAHAYIDQGQHRPIPCIYRNLSKGTKASPSFGRGNSACIDESDVGAACTLGRSRQYCPIASYARAMVTVFLVSSFRFVL